jgi:hypothetical protein
MMIMRGLLSIRPRERPHSGDQNRLVSLLLLGLVVLFDELLHSCFPLGVSFQSGWRDYSGRFRVHRYVRQEVCCLVVLSFDVCPFH